MKSKSGRLHLQVLPLLLVALTLTVAGCSRILGSNPIYGHTAAFNNNASVFAVCSPMCEQRGHCGTAQQGDQQVRLVMFTANGPSTQNFTALLSENQPVTVLESRVEPMVLLSSGAQFEMRFYRVQGQQATNVTGWVPGFCLADQTIAR